MKKILNYKVFWILTGLYFVFLGLGLFLGERILNNWVDGINRHLPLPLPHVTLYFFPEVWQNITFFAGIRYFLIFPAIIVIILITNEFTYKTIRQNIINGLSKGDILLSKLAVIFSFSVIITIVVGIVTLILGLMYTDKPGVAMMLSKILFLPAFFVELFTFLILAFTCGFLLRHTGLAIGFFTLYTIIIEPVVYYLLKIPVLQPNTVSAYLPVNSAIRLVEYPAIPMLKKMMGIALQDHVSLLHCAIAIGYCAIFIALTVYVVRKRDL
jgi:ABC-type transport system involved in multi-copper enzyme maturation permease subunit